MRAAVSVVLGLVLLPFPTPAQPQPPRVVNNEFPQWSWDGSEQRELAR